MPYCNNQQARGRRSTRRLQPRLEGLEERIVLSTFRVNTTLDTVAVNFKNGHDSTGHISLRSAIMAADAHGGSNTIIVPAGLFLLTIPGANEDASASGDLDLKGKIQIKGANSSATIIDGNDLDRVFQVLGGKISISNLTIQHGNSALGAGILNSGGQVTLSGVHIREQPRNGSGGAGRGRMDPAAARWGATAVTVPTAAWPRAAVSSMPQAR